MNGWTDELMDENLDGWMDGLKFGGLLARRVLTGGLFSLGVIVHGAFVLYCIVFADL